MQGVILALLVLSVIANILILRNQENHMPATRADLDAAIDVLVTTINKAFDDLLAKIAAGAVATPEDFTAEVTKIQALTASATTADPGATPATPTDTVNPTVTVEPNA